MPHASTLFFPVSFKYLLVFKINLKVFWIFGLILILFLLAFYIFQINSVISGGYQIQNYQKKLTELSKENETLAIDLARINSLNNVENRIKELGFEKVEKVNYIKILENQIVTK